MAVTYNKMLLDINEKPNDIITAVQNDTNSRYLDVLLYDNGIPIDLTGCEVKISMNKPENGGEIWNDGVITEAENGRCEFLLTTEALAKMGHLQVQISIWKENTEILSSQIFEIIVTKSLLGESSVESSNEYGTLVVLFQNLYEAYDLMTRMVENIGVPSEVAEQYDLATMWQAWEFLVAYMKGDLTDKIDEALANASVQGVLDLIGATADTGGSSTAGTVMAKLNVLYNNFNKAQEGRKIIEYRKTGGSVPSLTEVLNVSGKGKFYWANFYADQNFSNINARLTSSKSKVSIRVKLDGEIIAYFTSYPSGSTVYELRSYNLICSNQTLLINNEDALLPYSNYAEPVGYDYANFCPLSPTEQQNTTGASGYTEYIRNISTFIEGLQFEDSLKVEILNYTSDIYSGKGPSYDYYLTVGYTLDE